MDSWPTDNRNNDQNTVQRKAKGKSKDKAPSFQYPHLTIGSLGAVGLHENSGVLEWTSLVQPSNGNVLQPKGSPVKVFPATRPLPLLAPRSTVFQRAEQGAHFIRTYHPDVEIAAELIRDEIVEDVKTNRILESFDPHIANVLEVVHCHDGPLKSLEYMAFPMGEVNRELNISPFVYTKGEPIFKPQAQAIRTFDTPILQITASNSQPSNRIQSTCLAIRTFGSTSILQMKATSSSYSLFDVANIISSDVGAKSPVDILLSASPFEALIVNMHGGVYRCTASLGSKVLQRVHAVDDSCTDFFWKLAASENREQAFLASYKSVNRLDFRTDDNTMQLFNLQKPGEIFTSIEGPKNDHIVRLSSTTEVLWIDERRPLKPLLGYSHCRQFDRSLQVQTVVIEDSPLTFLTSRRNGLVTVYDVSRSTDHLVHINGNPYCLPPVVNYGMPHLGHAFFGPNMELGGNEIKLFQLSEQGDIHRLDLQFTQAGCTPSKSPSSGFEWSEGVNALNIQAPKLRSSAGPSGQKEFSEMDLFPLYDKMFRLYTEEARAAAEDNSNAVHELFERMPTCMQASDDPAEHMLTMFDVTFRSGDQPRDPSRADFLTGSALDSVRGYRALSQGRLSAEPMIKDVPWHYDITPILRKFDTHISKDFTAVVDGLKQYNLVPSPERSVHSLRRENEARDQLSLDLALSMDIFSPHAFLKPVDDDTDCLDTVSRATEALSLSDEPPPVHFGYLRPSDKSRKGNSEDCTLTPLGVRLLLKDWDVCTDPRDTVYSDPYNDSLRTANAIPHAKRIPEPQTQYQQPPLVVASKSVVPPNTQADVDRTAHTMSQPAIPRAGSQFIATNRMFPPSSQDFMTSTQILPGPFGGRQSLGKKKPSKKRLGGF